MFGNDQAVGDRVESESSSSLAGCDVRGAADDIHFIDGEELAAQFELSSRIGGVPLVLAGRNRSGDVRYESSSGGIFNALASWAIERGGVVYGCAFDQELRAVHIRCEDMPACERCMGSKYSQSDLGNSVSCVLSDLKLGRMVLFTGTPCQVAAVRRAVEVRGASFAGELLTCDIVCHGTPSPALFASHLEFISGERGKSVVKYWHRPKDLGHRHIEKIQYDDGTCETKTRLSDSWRSLFYDNRMLRPSCYRCPYTTLERCSDITIADYWKISGSSVAGFDDGKGVSLLLVNSDRGAHVLGDLAETELDLCVSRIEDALPGNPMLNHPSTYEGERDEPWQKLYQHGYARLLAAEGWYPSELRYMLRRIKKMTRKLMGRV